MWGRKKVRGVHWSSRSVVTTRSTGPPPPSQAMASRPARAVSSTRKGVPSSACTECRSPEGSWKTHTPRPRAKRRWKESGSAASPAARAASPGDRRGPTSAGKGSPRSIRSFHPTSGKPAYIMTKPERNQTRKRREKVTPSHRCTRTTQWRRVQPAIPRRPPGPAPGAEAPPPSSSPASRPEGSNSPTPPLTAPSSPGPERSGGLRDRAGSR
jgi:hypothetical protein